MRSQPAQRPSRRELRVAARLEKLDLVKRRLTVVAGALAVCAIVGAVFLYAVTEADARAGVVASSGIALAAYFARRLAPGEPKEPTMWDWIELFTYGVVGVAGAVFFGCVSDPPSWLVVSGTGLALLVLACMPTAAALAKSLRQPGGVDGGSGDPTGGA